MDERQLGHFNGYWQRIDELFHLGGLTIVGGALLAFHVITRATPLLSPETKYNLSYYSADLLPLATLAFFLAARRHRSPDLRSFFSRLGGAHLAWLLALMIRWPLEQSLGPGVETLVRDHLYGLYYVVLLWAIEWAPGQPAKSRGERLVALAGSLLLVEGSLIYLRIIPRFTLIDLAPTDTWLYLPFDLYIALRFASLALRARGSRMALLFGLLAVSEFCVAASDGLQLAFTAELVRFHEAPALSVWWLVPFIPLFLAAQVRGLESGRVEMVGGSTGLPQVVSALWSPLIAYGFALPAVHVVLYGYGLANEAAERPRAYFVLAWLLILALLIHLQRLVIAGRVRSNERSLRESYEQARLLSRARDEAVEDERARISEDLGDGLGKLLAALQREVARLSSHVDRADVAHGVNLDSASDLANRALELTHRIAIGLHPGTLDELGLAAALRELVAETGRGTTEVRLIATDAELDLSRELEMALYRIAHEALSHRLERSGARRIEVELLTLGDRVALEVRDDGDVVSPGQVASWTDLWLVSIQERVHAARGELIVGTGISDRGLSVRAVVPSVFQTQPSEVRGPA